MHRYMALLPYLITALSLVQCIPRIRMRYPRAVGSKCSLTTKVSIPGGKRMMRLERIVSNRGAGSRSDVMKLLKQRRVAVEGKVIRSGASKVSVDSKIEVDGKPLLGIPLLAAYHKPVGVHSTIGDPWGRSSLIDLHSRYPFLKGMHPVGRLDADTSGLLLFSSDGDLTQTLLHPSHGVQRYYDAIVEGTVEKDTLTSRLAAGVETTDGTFPAILNDAFSLDGKTKEADLVLSHPFVHSYMVDRASNSTFTGQPGAGTVSEPCSYVSVCVAEGKYRMVRRILHNTGHSVVRLHRVRYGFMRLGDLEVDTVRLCSSDEEDEAMSLMGE